MHSESHYALNVAGVARDLRSPFFGLVLASATALVGAVLVAYLGEIGSVKVIAALLGGAICLGIPHC